MGVSGSYEMALEECVPIPWYTGQDLPDTRVMLVLLNSVPAFYAEHCGFWIIPFLLAWRQLAYKVRMKEETLPPEAPSGASPSFATKHNKTQHVLRNLDTKNAHLRYIPESLGTGGYPTLPLASPSSGALPGVPVHHETHPLWRASTA